MHEISRWHKDQIRGPAHTRIIIYVSDTWLGLHTLPFICGIPSPPHSGARGPGADDAFPTEPPERTQSPLALRRGVLWRCVVDRQTALDARVVPPCGFPPSNGGGPSRDGGPPSVCLGLALSPFLNRPV